MATQFITEAETGRGSGAEDVPRLAARGVTVGYGGRTVIDGLDVTIPPGVITTIIGPNGCGKSTLLRTLTRLLKPDHGTVVLDGEDIGLPGPGTWRRSSVCCRRRRWRRRG